MKDILPIKDMTKLGDDDVFCAECEQWFHDSDCITDKFLGHCYCLNCYEKNKAIDLLEEIASTGAEIDEGLESDVVIKGDLFNEIYNFLVNNGYEIRGC